MQTNRTLTLFSQLYLGYIGLLQCPMSASSWHAHHLNIVENYWPKLLIAQTTDIEADECGNWFLLKEYNQENVFEAIYHLKRYINMEVLIMVVRNWSFLDAVVAIRNFIHILLFPFDEYSYTRARNFVVGLWSHSTHRPPTDFIRPYRFVHTCPFVSLLILLDSTFITAWNSIVRK